jgi:hypothetical protein
MHNETLFPPMPPMPARPSLAVLDDLDMSPWLIAAFCVVVLAIVVGVLALEALVLMLVLGALGIAVGFWLCLGIVFLCGIVLGALRR